MKAKTWKILSILIILLITICILTNVCEASWAITNPGAVKPNQTTLPTEANEMAGNLLGILQVVGSVISVIVLIIIGIRYMTGSASERAEYKKSMIPYLIGAVLLFSGTVFPKMIYDVVTSIQ